jgi:hypothetical protein
LFDGAETDWTHRWNRLRSLRSVHPRISYALLSWKWWADIDLQEAGRGSGFGRVAMLASCLTPHVKRQLRQGDD